MEFQPNEEGDQTNHSGVIRRFLRLQSNDNNPPRTNSKTKLLSFEKRSYGTGQPKKDRQTSSNQEDNAWKCKSLDTFMAAPLFEKQSYHSGPQTPLSYTPMVSPPELSVSFKPYLVTGIDTKDKSLIPMTSETKNTVLKVYFYFMYVYMSL